MITINKKDIPEHLLKYFKSKKIYKQKDDSMIPHRVYDALMSDGWYGRNDIVWAKTVFMPESCTDRCTRSKEYIFLLSKNKKYYYDNESIKEECTWIDNKDRDILKNKKDVWNIKPSQSSIKHFAPFPFELVENCIKASTSEEGCCSICGKPYKRKLKKVGEFQRRWSKNNKEGSPYNKQSSMQNIYETVGWEKDCSCENSKIEPCIVLDIFMGSGTTALVSRSLGRDFVGCELSEKYFNIIEQRLEEEWYSPGEQKKKSYKGDVSEGDTFNINWDD